MLLLLGFYLTGYLSLLSSGEQISFKYCKEAPNNVKSVVLSPCNTQPCVFHHNTTVNVEVTFTSQRASPKLNAQIYGIVAGIPVSFPMPNPNGCNKCNIACPIKQGDEYTYRSVMDVLPEYPNISIVVQWDLKDDSGNYEFCVLFPMVLTG